MEHPQPHTPPAEPTHDPPPAQPEPGPRPEHDPPLFPEHDRSTARPHVPGSWTPDLPQKPLPQEAEASSTPPPPEGNAPSSSDVGSDDQVQQTLDEALANSFPASDPVSIVTSQHEEAWQKDRSRK